MLNLTNRVWLSVFWSFIVNDTRHHSVENVMDSRATAERVHDSLTTVMTRIVVDKSTDHAKPHSICFLPQYQR